VRAAIIESLRNGDATIEAVAARLAVTPRTLQRRLAAERYTYKHALDEIRSGLADTYLTATALSLTEITYLLAYSDPSAFSRAFKRWTGATPIEYRGRQRQRRGASVRARGGHARPR
jgi:AraC-like DNA-binding protein